MPTQWDALLRRALSGLQSLEESGFALRHWTLGGGTALMLRLDHRDSKDIDLFNRIAAMSDRYFYSVIDELDIHPNWHWIVPQARQMVIEMVAGVPDL